MQVFIYAAVLQLILSSYRQSWPSFIIGAAVGLAYHANLFGIRKLKVAASSSGIWSLLGALASHAPSNGCKCLSICLASRCRIV